MKFWKVMIVIAVGLALGSTRLFAQSYDVRFLEVFNNGINFDVKVQISAADSAFTLGTSNFAFSFDTTALGSPTLLQANHFNSGNYDPIDVTVSPRNRVSVNVYLKSPNSADTVGIDTVSIATIRFSIKNPSASMLTWDTTSGGATVVWNGSESAVVQGRSYHDMSTSLLAVQLSSFTASVNQNRVHLQWTTLSETGNKAFYVQRRPDSVLAFTDIPGARLQGFDTTTATHNYSYVDSNLVAGTYHYRLRQMSEDSSSHYSVQVEAVVTLVSVEETKDGLPKEYNLQQNYPNPFNPSTTIQFGLPKDSRVTLEVYNIIGQRVSLLIDQTMSAGYHTVQFDGQKLASGVYFYRLQARALNSTTGGMREFIQTRKLMLLK